MLDKLLKQLEGETLSTEEKSRVVSVLLGKIHAFPIRHVISLDTTGTLLINGEKLDPTQTIALQQGAVALRDSKARQIINDQLMYKAIKIGIDEGLSPETILFSKALMWLINEENILVRTLTGE